MMTRSGIMAKPFDFMVRHIAGSQWPKSFIVGVFMASCVVNAIIGGNAL